MADYITDTGLAAVLRLGLDGAKETPLSSLPRFHAKRSVSPEVPVIDVQVHITPMRATDQAARTIEPAATLR